MVCSIYRELCWLYRSPEGEHLPAQVLLSLPPHLLLRQLAHPTYFKKLNLINLIFLDFSCNQSFIIIVCPLSRGILNRDPGRVNTIFNGSAIFSIVLDLDPTQKVLIYLFLIKTKQGQMIWCH